MSVLFEVMYESFVAVDIGSEVLVLSLCTRFPMSVVVGTVCAASDALSRVPVDFVFKLVDGVQKCDS